MATPTVKSLEGLARPEERAWLTQIAATLPANALVLEIGTYLGATAAALRAGLASGLVVTVDLYPGQRMAQSRAQLESLGFKDVVQIRADSAALHKFWTHPIDLLYIDGGHQPHNVRNDLALADSYVVIGGIVALHDARPPAKPYNVASVNGELEKWVTSRWIAKDAPGSIRAFKRLP